jgi:hypothetical protein
MLINLVLFASLSQVGETSWRYVTPPPGVPHEHAPLRAMPLGALRPDDIVENVTYRGTKRRYGQLRFGSPSSVRVTIVLDEFGPGQAALYVDADRNRRIEEKDRVDGKDRTWRVPLNVAIVEGELTSYTPRTVLFRLGATGLTFSQATTGYLEGTVTIDDRAHKARRIDGDGNGLFADPQDQIWIDLDDDGRWDAAREQFLFQPILALGEGRFALKADGLGERLSLAPLEGTGTIRIALNRPEGAAPLRLLAATLIGRDGSAISLSGPSGEVTVPVGEYRVGTLVVVFEDRSVGADRTFVSAAEGARGEPRWYQVGKGGTVSIDPIGKLAFTTGAVREVRPGDDLRIQPALHTGDGLLIVTSYNGSPTAPSSDNGPGARIALRDQRGRTVGTAHSGFA